MGNSFLGNLLEGKGVELSIYLGLGIAVMNMLVGIINLQKGLYIYLLLAFVCPTIILGNQQISYDLLGFFAVCVLLFFNSKKKKTRPLIRHMGLYFFLLFISTLISVLLKDSTINYISVLGYARLILLLYFLQLYCEKETLRKAVYNVVVINFVVMLLQYFSDTAAIWSYRLFAKSSSQALSYYYSIGKIDRLTGTFSNILPVAYFMLFAFIVSLAHYCEKNSETKKDLFVLFFSLVCGGLAVSKSFILGLPLVIISWIVFSKVFHRKEYDVFRGKRVLLILIIIIFIVASVILKDSLRMSNVINYYLESVRSGEFFASRYNESGVLKDAIEVIKDNWLIGIGSATLHSEFLGDSQYITILHNTGILGLMIIISMFISYARRLIHLKSVPGLTAIVLIMAVGFAGTTVFSTIGIVLLSYVFISAKEKNNSNQSAHANVKVGSR